MGYVHHITQTTHFAGIKLITPGTPSYYAFDFANPPAGTINMFDGFTNAEKYQALAGGVARKTAGAPGVGNDVSFMIGAHLPDLNPGDTTTIALAVLAGDNLADLQASAQAAQTQYYFKPTTGTGTKPGIARQPLKVYPNPVSDLLQIELPSQFGKAETHLELLNSVGKTVASQAVKPGAKASLNVAGLAAGLYVLKTSQNGMVQTQKIQVVK
jgi:hypothetical protein